MKKQTYLEFIQTLLPEGEFSLFKEFYQARISKSIKIINSRINKEDFSDILKDLNWTLSYPDISNGGKPYDDVLFVSKEDKNGLWSSFLHEAWMFYVQEVAAGLSAQVLPLKKWDIVLDLCAAPWWKSIQLADRLLSLWGWFLFANEPLSPRRKALIFNLNRCWCYNTAITAYDWTQIWELAPEIFDKVLVDAPCSWEWMQYKSDKNVSYRDQKTAEKLANLQKKLLISGLKALKVWWELVYSTCTLNPFENEGVLKEVLESYPSQIELLNVPIDQKSKWNEQFLSKENSVKVARFWPHIQRTWWFFIAKIKKIKSISYNKQIDKRAELFNLNDSSEIQKRVRNELGKNRWILENKNFKFYASSQAIYCTSHYFCKTPLFIEKLWIPIFKYWHNNEFIPQQGLAICLWDYAKKNTVALTVPEFQSLFQSTQLPWKFWDNWVFLLTKLWGKGIFLTKQVNEQLKLKS